MLLEFSLGKLACEVDQWNRRPPSWGRGISLSLDLAYELRKTIGEPYGEKLEKVILLALKCMNL